MFGLTIYINNIKMKIGDNMVIMYVRHGDSVDDKLTRLGESQCELMVAETEKYEFSKIYCSVTNRCKMTAKYLSEKYNLETEYVEGVRDRGLLNRDPETNEERLWYDNYLNKNFSSKKPEGCKEFLERNFKEFDKIIKNHKKKNENVILVAHSSTFYALQEYLNKSLGDEIKYYRVSNCARVYFEIK